jgi:hypothetical protein
MKIFKIGALALLATVSICTVSCTKDFKEINSDPNRSVAATPESLLAPALYDVVTRNQTRALRLTNELMQVHVTTINSDEIHRYVIRPNESDYMWNNWYLQLTNFRDMYARASALQQKTFMGMALISDVWVSSLITDMFGDVPYSEAAKGRENIYQPKFDEQKDIYLDLFRKLEEANTLLAANQTVAIDKIPLDPIYGAKLDLSNATTASANLNANWRKFGNSLYLRLLMRVSGKAEANAAAKIKEIVETNKAAYPIFTSNAESAIVKFTTTPYTTAFNTYRAYDFNGDNGLSEFFINNLKEWGDPRIDRWASKVSGSYEGIPSGYSNNQVPVRKSYYLESLMNEPLLGNIINYPEVQFLLAEAALRGYISGDPKTYYENGITNAIAMWGVTMPAGYLTGDDVKWDNALMFDVKLEKIMLQKYYTLFFTDFQQWYEYRRTGHPVLPKGPGLQNGGLMPSRFLYPVGVQSLNQANYSAAVAAQGPDDLNTKVWWNK